MRLERRASLAACLAVLLCVCRLLSADQAAPALPDAAGATPDSTARDSWPTFKGDNARTGRGPSLRLPISVDWTVQLKGSLYSSPAVSGGLVVLGSSDKRVYGLSLATGATRWERILPDRVWGSAPAIEDGRVYIGCVDACVYALSLTAGTILHTYCAGSNSFFRSGDVLCPMLVDGRRLVFGSDDHSIYGFDLSTGGHWACPTGGELHDNGAAEEAGLVVMASRDEDVYCMGVNDGQLRWTFKAGGAFNTVPALDAERAYLGCADGKVYALSLADGTQAWAFDTGKGIMSSPALADDGSLVVGSANGEVYCLDAATGARRWAFKTGDYVLSSPMVTGQLVWIGSYDGFLYVLDLASGRDLWRLPVAGGVYAAPAFADGRVLIAGRKGSLTCLKAFSAP